MCVRRPREKPVAAVRNRRRCFRMNIPMAQGQEFNGVVLVQGAQKPGFFDAKEQRGRRLLRVALTHTPTPVTIIRPRGARPLVD
jgi:hypothetical protein